MHKEQAIQSLLKSTIRAPPGGQTGHVLFSLTVESFLGFGVVLS